jgi:hypothetical protein
MLNFMYPKFRNPDKAGIVKFTDRPPAFIADRGISTRNTPGRRNSGFAGVNPLNPRLLGGGGVRHEGKYMVFSSRKCYM